ncbi:MAG: type II secretion system protein GspM [Gammaproteobacteria bacterium]|nr:type II secretion system protein GspM [Gammaproteobacteria bacterium]MDH3429236.1 type II secretion system protein GspM [Gammaproteobacteria bacterium]MDH3433233.1 type II secretion system protein GspM [Gammaproteobacteria bacterium]
MIRQLGDKQRQRLAIALLIAALGIILSVTAMPIWVANATYRDNIDELNDRLQTYNRVATRDADLLPQFEQLKHSQLTDGHYLRSETVAVAGAELQRMVKEIAAANRAQLLSTQILPASREQGFVQVTLKVRLRGTLEGVLRSFYDMETKDVYLFLDNISMRNSTAVRRPRQIAIQQMDADFDLVAYMPDIT